MSAAPGQINIAITDNKDVRLEFKVKPSTKWQKIVKVYATKLSVDPTLLRFSIDGVPIKASDNITVQDVGLGEGGSATVQMLQVGGGWILH
ncbi:hypothetical protein BC828DRAFT_384963, partial [Blastocladiella britannica]